MYVLKINIQNDELKIVKKATYVAATKKAIEDKKTDVVAWCKANNWEIKGQYMVITEGEVYGTTKKYYLNE